MLRLTQGRQPSPDAPGSAANGSVAVLLQQAVLVLLIKQPWPHSLHTPTHHHTKLIHKVPLRNNLHLKAQGVSYEFQGWGSSTLICRVGKL